ncbi:MAG: hypothetical protein Kow00108_11700 [Calditrichia bacterium]
MKRFLLVLLILGLVFTVMNCSKKEQETAKEEAAVETTMEKATFTADMLDVTKCGCGMDLAVEGATIADTVHYHGKVVGFCGDHCKEAFQADPEGYLSKLEAPAEDEAEE